VSGPLVLASRSPQRRAILDQLGIAFVARPVDVDEDDSGTPALVVADNARRKALAAPAERHELVLGVDTVVAIEDEIWGKPADARAARETLRRLAGRTHRVLSAIALVRDGALTGAATAVTEVRFRALDDDLVDWYVATDEWRERAGGYAIQGRGAALVVAIDGDYSNVVGLPVVALLELAPELLRASA